MLYDIFITHTGAAPYFVTGIEVVRQVEARDPLEATRIASADMLLYRGQAFVDSLRAKEARTFTYGK